MYRRERNPDLLTALSLLTLGTYTRLPTSLTESFTPRSPQTNRALLNTLQRLNQHLLYRLRCVDYLPPEMVIETIRHGRVYVCGGGVYGWKAQLTAVGFEEDSRWWLTGLEWGWRVKEKGVDDPGGSEGGKVFQGDERQQILDMANEEVLVPRHVQESEAKNAEKGSGTMERNPSTAESVDAVTRPDSLDGKKVDAPLVRIYNFLRTVQPSSPIQADVYARTPFSVLPT